MHNRMDMTTLIWHPDRPYKDAEGLLEGQKFPPRQFFSQEPPAIEAKRRSTIGAVVTTTQGQKLYKKSDPGGVYLSLPFLALQPPLVSQREPT